jgi:hypothetical protein
MLGLPDGDTDPYFDTLPDQQSRATRSNTAADGGEPVSPDESSSSADSEAGDLDDGSQASGLEGLLEEPPELVAARKKLEAYRAGGWWQCPLFMCLITGEGTAHLLE